MIDQVPRDTPLIDKATGRIGRIWDVWCDSVRRTANPSSIGGTFANNAAAVAGGLAVGQFYQTAAGEVRVVV